MNLDKVLKAIGCLGSFEIDFQSQRVRTTGCLAAIHGLKPTRAAEGIPLAVADRIVHPDDLDELRRTRNTSMKAQSGRRVMRFRVVDADGQLRWMESHTHVLVDRYGMVARTTGIVIDATPLATARPVSLPDPASLVGLDDLTGTLIQAYRTAKELRLGTIQGELQPILAKVVQLVGTRMRQSTMH